MISKILKEKRKWIEKAKEKVPQKELLQHIQGLSSPRSLSKSLSKAHQIHLIAEIKKASPSAGILRESFDPVAVAQIYQANGADAISVLTDEPFFKGSLEHLREVKRHVQLPVLRKDFILDVYQIYESRAAGADAILLIASLLKEKELLDFLSLIHSLEMEALLEVHTDEDLQKSLKANASIIGINQRDLHTFKIQRSITSKLISLIPKGKVIVCESGIRNREDILYLKALGVHAVLIGEAFMRSCDIGGKMKELFRYIAV